MGRLTEADGEDRLPAALIPCDIFRFLRFRSSLSCANNLKSIGPQSLLQLDVVEGDFVFPRVGAVDNPSLLLDIVEDSILPFPFAGTGNVELSLPLLKYTEVTFELS